MHAVIQLVYYQGMKYREAAEVLDIPVGHCQESPAFGHRQIDRRLENKSGRLTSN